MDGKSDDAEVGDGPNRCFYNATRAVWAHPDRLVYVEGFYINEYHITHHAWALDKLTDTRHELSFQHRDPTKNSLTGPRIGWIC
jgi:hypothetical protein